MSDVKKEEFLNEKLEVDGEECLYILPGPSPQVKHMFKLQEDKAAAKTMNDDASKPTDQDFYVDKDTGGTKEVKLERHDLIPTYPLRELARHYGRGAKKYADRNWELGYPWSLSYAAVQRHLTAWWEGEDLDPETGSSHLTAAAWHCFTLLEFMGSHPDKDDRPKHVEDFFNNFMKARKSEG